MGPIEIEITPVSDTRVSVNTQYASDPTPLRKRWYADRSVIDGICADLDDILEEVKSEPPSEDAARERDAEMQQRLRSLGLALFQEILREEGDVIKKIGTRPEVERYVTFEIDRSLAYLPVELMHDGEDFLSQRFALGRVVYADHAEEPPARRRAMPRRAMPYRILIAADPSDDPAIRDDIEEEIAAIREVVAEAREFSLKISVGPDVNRKSLLADLPGTTVFHFTGHGTQADAAGAGAGARPTGIRLGGGKVLTGEALRGLQDPPTFAFLNMCMAASRRAWTSSLNLVETLLGRGTKACVASLWDLRSRAAARLAASFYSHLLDGDTFGHALRRARLEIVKTFGTHDLTWAAYTLYGDPRLRLLSTESLGARSRPRLRTFAAVSGILFLLALLLFPASLGEKSDRNGLPVPVGYLQIESRPAGATILIDGEEEGVTPSTIEIDVGGHRVVLQKQGYRRWEAWVEVYESDKAVLRPQLMELD